MYTTEGDSGNTGSAGFVGDASWYGAYIVNSYSNGTVECLTSCSQDTILSGFSVHGSCTNCYWDTQTSGINQDYCATGKTTNELRQQATFANWDFFETWMIKQNTDYPLLKNMDWQKPGVEIKKPKQGYYNTDTIKFEVYAKDKYSYIDKCWYSTDYGETNTTMNEISLGKYEHTKTGLIDGSHTANIYCNDTSGKINDSEKVTFNIDTQNPEINFDEPPTPIDNTFQIEDEFTIFATSTDTNQVNIIMDFDETLLGWWRMDEYDSNTDQIIDN